MKSKPQEEGYFKILEGQYILHETVGQGGFGKVKKATHIVTGERVAIKILDKAKLRDDLPRVENEILTLQTLSHPYICKLYQVLQTDEHILMVMEYCRGGELFDYIVQRDRVDESEARKMFRQIASACSYVHNKGIAHRDLKPENILLDSENKIKLIDFGLCALPPGGMNSKLETACGSPQYAAPELVKGESYIGHLADVWSLGVNLYALLCGFLPFEDENLSELYKKIVAGKYSEPKFLSEGSKNILRCMLNVDPSLRLSVDELLRHTWCQEGVTEPLPSASVSDQLHNLMDMDVINVMADHSGQAAYSVRNKIKLYDYESYDLATYFILADRKFKLGAREFRALHINMQRIAYNNRIQKSLETEFSECDSMDSLNVTPAKGYHSSMEGGLDDCRLLQIGSPKIEVEDNKENEAVDFAVPRIPTPKKSYIPENTLSLAMKSLSPSRSAESVLTDSLKTPTREKWRGANPNSPSALASPARRKLLGSIEKGLDRVRLMLTPRTGKGKNKLKTIAYRGKGAFNVSATASSDPDCVIAELKESLARIGIQCLQKGYRLIGTMPAGNLKFELEVVFIDSVKAVGIRRKRTSGDSWAYKKVVEQVLSLTGVCQLPKKKPLQTMV